LDDNSKVEDYYRFIAYLEVTIKTNKCYEISQGVDQQMSTLKDNIE